VAALHLADRLPVHTTGRLALWLAVTIGVGAIVFAMTSVLLRSPERLVLWGMLPSRRRR
jgi:hypothetical protein